MWTSSLSLSLSLHVQRNSFVGWACVCSSAKNKYKRLKGKRKKKNLTNKYLILCSNHSNGSIYRVVVWTATYKQLLVFYWLLSYLILICKLYTPEATYVVVVSTVAYSKIFGFSLSSLIYHICQKPNRC